MKKKLFVFFIISFLLFVNFVFANTVNRGTNNSSKTITITNMTSDWSYASIVRSDQYLYIISIKFIGGAVNDHLIVRDQSATGPEFYDRRVFDTNIPCTDYIWGNKKQPYIKFSEGVFSPNHKIIIEMGQ